MQHTFTKRVVSVQTYFYKEHSTQVEMNGHYGQFVYNDTDDYRGCQPATDRTSTALTGLWTPFILTFVIHSMPIRTIDCPNLEMVSENCVGVGITDKIYEL